MSKNKKKITYNKTLKIRKSNNDTLFKVDVKDRRILILYTGGTIGMVETIKGHIPKKGYLQRKLKNYLKTNNSKDSHEPLSKYDIISLDPLLDSSNIHIKDWNRIISKINKYYHQYSAFIIIHGTDTLAYTASALSFAFENLDKPIIITGSQIPIQNLKNDGWNNLITSLILASQTHIPEVLVVFSDHVLRGNRSKKISANKIDAFESPNYEKLGNFGFLTSKKNPYNWTLEAALLKKENYSSQRNDERFTATFYNENIEVIIIYLTPGFNPENIIHMIGKNRNIKGAILVSFGVGDGPTSDKNFIRMLSVLDKHHIIVLNITQCVSGHIDSNDYETGIMLQKYNVISGNDMTLECGYAKLLYLLSKYRLNNIGPLLETSIRGELSPTPTSFEI